MCSGSLVLIGVASAALIAAMSPSAVHAQENKPAQPGNPAPEPDDPAEKPFDPESEAEAAGAEPVEVPAGATVVKPLPAVPAAAQQPLADDTPMSPEVFRFPAFAEPVELTVLVNYVRDQLGIPMIATDSGLVGKQVVLSSPIDVPKDLLLPFVATLLEQKGYILTQGVAGIYIIQPMSELQAGPGEGQLSTTRVIPTPGLRPSALQPAVISLGITTPPPGRPPVQPLATVAYLDDMGVILITGTPRQTRLVAELVDRLSAQQQKIGHFRYELHNVAGLYARDRVLELMGGQTAGRIPAQQAQQGGQPVPISAPTGSTSNLDERLTVDPQGNALYFRGRPDEVRQLEGMLAIIDVPNSLTSKWYGIGRAAEAVALAGERQGLGTVVFQSVAGGDVGGDQARLRQQQQGFPGAQQQSRVPGPVFVVYQDIGGFMYSGTPRQQELVSQLVANLNELTAQELIVYEFYKLRHSKSEDVAEIIQNLLTNSVPTNTAPLVGGDLGRGGRRQTATGAVQPAQRDTGAPEGGAGDVTAIRADEDTFVLADPANNQVVVKASKKRQPQFARLIERLDIRRPQVYIDVKIVAVTATEEFRLAFESQIIAGDFALNTNFGLGGFAENGQFTDRKGVGLSLSGLTAAIIRSDQVPLIINALQQNVETRILSTPQLLVDDNEEAEVTSVNRQPFTTISQTTGNPQTTGFGGESEAGTKLKVTPQISEGGYLKLNYDIELSSFTGSAASANVPPPSQVNNIRSASVTVPSDSTIVVGGLTFESLQDTVFKIPFLGDIPVVGQLFRDERKNKQNTTLYVFITPTIMRDPNFADLRLLTRGPAKVSGIVDDLPEPAPVRIDILGRPAGPAGGGSTIGPGASAAPREP